MELCKWYFGLICVLWYHDLCKSMYDVSVGVKWVEVVVLSSILNNNYCCRYVVVCEHSATLLLG